MCIRDSPIQSHDEGSCIDHVFIKSRYQASAGKCIDSITDHYPILISLHGNDIKSAQKEIHKINKKRFIELCNIEPWEEVYNAQNNDVALDFLIHKIHIINQRSLKTIPKTQKPRKNWITPALINTIKDVYKRQLINCCFSYGRFCICNCCF